MLSPPALALRSAGLCSLTHGDRQLRRLAERGVTVRVAPGAYVDDQRWQALTRREQYLAQVHARLVSLPSRVVASHWSAGAAWGFPIVDDWPERLQIIDVDRGRTNSTPTILRRPGPLDPAHVVAWEGCSVTGPARTAVDIALADGFDAGVLVVDFGLREGLFDLRELDDHLQDGPRAKRLTAEVKALEFADSGSASAGESFSRIAIARHGFVPPVLQHAFSDARGTIGYVDFWWPDAGVVGEFDGDWKYTDSRFLNGRTAAEVIRDEKRRQARLDAHPEVRRVIRWDYAVARRPSDLARRLLAAGVQCVTPGGRS